MYYYLWWRWWSVPYHIKRKRGHATLCESLRGNYHLWITLKKNEKSKLLLIRERNEANSYSYTQIEKQWKLTTSLLHLRRRQAIAGSALSSVISPPGQIRIAWAPCSHRLRREAREVLFSLISFKLPRMLFSGYTYLLILLWCICMCI